MIYIYILAGEKHQLSVGLSRLSRNVPLLLYNVRTNPKSETLETRHRNASGCGIEYGKSAAICILVDSISTVGFFDDVIHSRFWNALKSGGSSYSGMTEVTCTSPHLLPSYSSMRTARQILTRVTIRRNTLSVGTCTDQGTGQVEMFVFDILEDMKRGN